MSGAWIALLLGGISGGPEAALSEGRAALQRQDFARAAQALSRAADLMPGCADLEYDVGTAAAQAGQVGPAVLHLERALRASPWDGDARQNLERIRQKRIDKVMGQEPGESPLQRLAAGLPGRLLFWLGLFAWWAAFALFFARRLLGHFWGGTGWTVLLLVLAVFGFAGAAAAQAEASIRYAVITGGALSASGQGVKVHSGPAGDLPTSFEVHEGLKILMLDSENGFTHIRLGNGLEGYVADGDLEEI